MRTNKLGYDLVLKKRKYRDSTLCSIYYKSKKKIEKEFVPVDINGYRYRLNTKTGEITTYSRDICGDSKGASVRRSRIRLNMMLDMNDFDWFATLTFDPKRLDRTNADEVYEMYRKWIDLMTKHYPNMRYITVPEKHEDGCYHFHMLIGGISTQDLGLVNSGKVCCHWSTKNGIASKEYFKATWQDHKLEETDGIPIYNITKFQYGYTTVSRIQSRERCNFYVKKYIDKNFGTTDDFKKRYFYSTNLRMPEESEIILAEKREYLDNLVHLKEVQNNLLYQYGEKQHYNENFNNLQFWVDNDYLDKLDKGLIPLELIENIQLRLDE